MPPKRSRGKPALSRVPFLESVNGDCDYSGSGEEKCTGGFGGRGGGRPSKEPALWPGKTLSSSKPLGTGQGDGLPSQVIHTLLFPSVDLKFELVMYVHGNKSQKGTKECIMKNQCSPPQDNHC